MHDCDNVGFSFYFIHLAIDNQFRGGSRISMKGVSGLDANSEPLAEGQQKFPKTASGQ